LAGVSVERALQSVYFRLSVELRASPPFRCSQVATQQGRNVVLELTPVNAVRTALRNATDLLIPVPISWRALLVRTFFSFSTWPDKHSFINDYKLLKADVAKLLAQIEQSYV